MTKFPLATGFFIGACAGGGVVAIFGLGALLGNDSARNLAVAFLVTALIVGVACGVVVVGWVQSWRDAV